jgi:hypothetical protein
LRPRDASELGGGRGQSRLVAVGNREIAAARGKLHCQRPADAARRARDPSGASVDRSHSRTPMQLIRQAGGPKGRFHRFSQIGTEQYRGFRF